MLSYEEIRNFPLPTTVETEVKFAELLKVRAHHFIFSSMQREATATLTIFFFVFFPTNANTIGGGSEGGWASEHFDQN